MTFSPDADVPVINVEKGGLKANFIADFKEDRTPVSYTHLDVYKRQR